MQRATLAGTAAAGNIRPVLHNRFLISSQINLIHQPPCADLPPEAHVEELRGHPRHPLDVVCLVKRNLTDSALSQQPMVFWPWSRNMQAAVPRALRQPKPPRYVTEWLELAQALLSIRPGDRGVQRAAAYLLELAQGQRGLGDPPGLPWHEGASVDLNLLPESSVPIVLAELWPAARLKVVVQRRPKPVAA